MTNNQPNKKKATFKKSRILKDYQQILLKTTRNQEIISIQEPFPAITQKR
jgi:hypothetical protein